MWSGSSLPLNKAMSLWRVPLVTMGRREKIETCNFLCLSQQALHTKYTPQNSKLKLPVVVIHYTMFLYVF